jgi:hypothetical protein
VARVVIDMGAIAEIQSAIEIFQEDRLGPLIVADAKRYAPKRSGEMAGAIFHRTDGTTLFIVSPAPYSAWVELGHYVYHPSTGATGPERVPEEPFLRPALYKYRTPGVPDPPATFATAVGHPGVSYPSLFVYETEKLGWRFE